MRIHRRGTEGAEIGLKWDEQSGWNAHPPKANVGMVGRLRNRLARRTPLTPALFRREREIDRRIAQLIETR